MQHCELHLDLNSKCYMKYDYQGSQSFVGILQSFCSDMLSVSCRIYFDVKLVIIFPFLITLNKTVCMQL